LLLELHLVLGHSGLATCGEVAEWTWLLGLTADLVHPQSRHGVLSLEARLPERGAGRGLQHLLEVGVGGWTDTAELTVTHSLSVCLRHRSGAGWDEAIDWLSISDLFKASAAATLPPTRASLASSMVLAMTTLTLPAITWKASSKSL